MIETSFEGFYRDSRDGCFRAVIVAVGNPVEAEDLLAEAYARCLEHWNEVRGHPAPEGWVVTVAINLARDRWRRARLAAKTILGRDVVDPPSLPIDPALLAAVRSLPAQQRRVVALRAILDFDTAQTADLLGIAPGTVTTHLHRALATLRNELSKEKVN